MLVQTKQRRHEDSWVARAAAATNLRPLMLLLPVPDMRKTMLRAAQHLVVAVYQQSQPLLHTCPLWRCKDPNGFCKN